ncbi:MAG: hypothetical protein M1833_003651 [Piccolia ochrophora]|nr:MAG: hypothetical protein M1833_003651 [Piccolia ochrophora]
MKDRFEFRAAIIERTKKARADLEKSQENDQKVVVDEPAPLPFANAALQPGSSNIAIKSEDDDDQAIKSPGRGSNLYSGLTAAKKRKRSTDDKEALQRPHAPPKKPTKTVKTEYETVQILENRTVAQRSEWYDNIDPRGKFSRQDLATLQHVRTLIKDCERGTERFDDLSPIFSNLRKRIHQMEFYGFLTGTLIKRSKVLEEDVGLPLLFQTASKVSYPWDIRADAEALFLRWLQGVLDAELLRGIETSRKQRSAGKAVVSHSLKPDYTARVSCNVAGSNGLQNGQWWPMQICALRDGAHGEIEAGIHGQPGKGALSVILSSGGYDDVDDGKTVFYCGTSGSEGQPTAGTNHLKEANRLKSPVRVLRSAALPRKNKYRPSKGLRFDGLYDVTGFEILDERTAMHRFSLQRRAGQDPLRYTGVECRPTDEEVAEYTKIRGLLGMTS